MVTRGEMGGEVRYFLRDHLGAKVATVILHRPVREALLAGHLCAFEEEAAALDEAALTRESLARRAPHLTRV